MSQTINTVNGARVMQLEAELEDKTRYIEDMEYSYQHKIDNLQMQLNDKTRALNRLKEKQYQEIQFQAELDNKNRSLNDLKLQHKEEVLKLKEEIKYKDEIIDSLKDFENQTLQLKSQLESKELTISQLESDIQSSQIISTQYEESQEIQKKLKSDISKLKKFARSLSLEKSKVENDLEKSLEQIKQQKNEISVLKAEKSFAQSQVSRSDIIFSGSPQKNSHRSNNSFTNNASDIVKSNDQNLDDEEMLKTLLKMENLRQQLYEEKEKLRQNEELVNALKTNLKETQTDNQNMKKQLFVIEAALTRKDTRIQKLKIDIVTSNNQIKQKELLINELLAAENKKCDEIERLHQEIDKLIVNQKEIRIKETQNDENIFKVNKDEYQNLLDTLNQYKSEKNQLDALFKQNQSHTKELESELQATKRKFSLREQKIANLLKENAELNSAKDGYSSQVRRVEQELVKQVGDLKTSLEETTKENTELTRQYRDAMQSVSHYSSMVDSLRTENAGIKKENGELQSTIQQQILPLQTENARLTKNAQKFKEARDSLMREKQQLIVENAQLKAQVNHFDDTKGIQGKGENDLNSAATYEELEDRLNEANDALNTLYSFLEVNSVNEFQKKWQKSVEETESLLTKNKVLEQQQASLMAKIDKLSSKSDERPKSKATTSAIQLRSELTQEKKKAGTYQSQSEILQRQIDQLESDCMAKDSEIEELKKGMAKYQDEIDLLHNCIQFESMENLREEITSLLSEREKSMSTIQELSTSLKKLQSEKDESLTKLERQQQAVGQMTASLKELRNENLSAVGELRAENVRLQNELKQADEARENLLLEIGRLHELFTFESEDDLFFAVSSEIEKMKSAAEDVAFKLSQSENKIGAKDAEIDFLNKNINEKKELINQLKEERNALKNENFKLSASIKASTNDAASKQMNEICKLVGKKSVAEILPAISSMKNKQQKQKEKIESLKRENEKLELKVNEVENSMSLLIIDKEKAENELSILKISMSDDRGAKLEHKISDKEDTITELKEQKSEFIRICADKDEKIKAFEEENLNMLNQLSQIQAKLRQTNVSLDQKASENESLKTEIKTLKSKIRDLCKKESNNTDLIEVEEEEKNEYNHKLFVNEEEEKNEYNRNLFVIDEEETENEINFDFFKQEEDENSQIDINLDQINDLNERE